MVASLVWERLGDVDSYVEPFFGSGAVLLGSPWPSNRTETVNDKDGFIANLWRALANDPVSVASYADWPVSEADLFARHIYLVNHRDELLSKLHADPEYYDARMAGWWVWGMSSWIGTGWCSGDGPWNLVEGEVKSGNDVGVSCQLPSIGGGGKGVNSGHGVNRQLPHLGSSGQGVNRKLGVTKGMPSLTANQGITKVGVTRGMPNVSGPRGVHRKLPLPTDMGGVNRKLPHLGSSGCGVNRKLPHIGGTGRGVHRQLEDLPDDSGSDLENEICHSHIGALLSWFWSLSERLRRVRICCGDWSRVVSEGALSHGSRIGIFMDPPYSAAADRESVYACDDDQVAVDVRKWCLEHGDDPKYRIVLCGYDGEHDMPPTWEVVAWKARGSYVKPGSKGNLNREKERLWFSPHCMNSRQASLFDLIGDDY